jgi:protease-4
MYNEVLHFKEATNYEKPVIAVLMDVAASGGYYIACAADEIWAHPTTITCSIGVIMQFVNFEGTMYKIGLEANTIKSVPMKDAGSPLRQMKQEERALFQSLVEQFHEQFVAAVANGRQGLTEEDVRQIADGAICSAEQARELRLIDEIGTLRDVIAAIKTQLAAERVRVIAYHRPLGYKPNVYARQPASPPQMNVFNIDLPAGWISTTPRFMYLWAPGF